MKLLKTKHGVSIYMHQMYVNGGVLTKRFYVFKENNFVLEITFENVLQMLTFFEEL